MFGESRKTWLEAGLDGRDPETLIAEGIACAMAGAAILRLPLLDVPTHARIREGIRTEIDAILYPVADAAHDPSVLAELARLGLLEWLPLVPGSANLAGYDDLREDRPGSVLSNPEPRIREALGLARRHDLQPVFSILEPGFVRLGATLYWRESSPAPLYRITLSASSTFGFPPEDYALTAYLKLLDQVAPGAQWMVAGEGADLLALVPRIVVEGGHVCVASSDLPGVGAAERAEQAAARILECGGELAPAREVRQALRPEDDTTGL